MKNLFKLAVILLGVIAFNACNSGGGTPEAVAETFLNHLNKKEYADAKKLGTENTVKMLETLETFAAMGDEADTEAEAETEEFKIEEISSEIDGDNAVCTYKTSDGKEDKIELVKQDGKWLVDMKKEGMGGEGDTELTDDTEVTDDTEIEGDVVDTDEEEITGDDVEEEDAE